MSFLNFNGNFIEEIGFPVAAASFQAPTWSPDGSHLLVATQTQIGTRELVLTDIQGTPLQTLLTYAGNIAFGFSPDGQKVAAITGVQLWRDLFSKQSPEAGFELWVFRQVQFFVGKVSASL